MKPGSAGNGFAGNFSRKSEARAWVWDALEQQGLARYPYPPHDRIPNFVGARQAAARLLAEAPWHSARAIKVSPDSPQRYVRQAALERGIRVYVPTPRLRGGFQLLDPERIPVAAYGAAASRATMARWAVPVALSDLPQFDGIVTGCVAVTPAGKRAGKGAGYSDLEYAILRDLGFAAVPVATTVHDVQVVEDFPVDSHDQPVTVICTPTRTLRVERPLPAPAGVEWQRLDPAALQAMPILGELRDLLQAPRQSDVQRHGGRP
jgi:5-formyltetrahydrofolate cyclo-ligase